MSERRLHIHIPVLPDGIAEFNREVIPLLQASGAFPSAAFPSAYDCSTIRERLRDPREISLPHQSK
ncbi:hypothetical protein [Frankia tisae]|uniref:hypothetical protein n=1 Tax=Frankia tisae TaxID=2950104 RepID=UPI0021C0800B|nr:hypothetical protein [Frankia tisae]